jgi:hypothetical protein
MDMIADRGYSSITLTGGEVTMREDFPKICSYALEKQFDITVQTNGRLLSAPHIKNFLEGCQGNSKLNFVIALHGSTANIHDNITNTPDSFLETINGIKLLSSLAFRMTGKIVMSLKNIKDLSQTLKLYKELSINEVVVAFPHAEEFDDETFSSVVPRYKEVGAALDAVMLASEGFPKQIRYETIPFCILSSPTMWYMNTDLAFSLQKHQNQQETLISMAMAGDLINWSEERLKSKKKSGDCSLCLLDYLCEGPWIEYVMIYGNQEFIPITDTQRVEEFISKLEV